MNFYDVLAAEKWSGGIPTINFFDLLFAQSLGGGEQWETYEGTLPATINANGDNMKQYQVYGAAGGVGDRTVNFWQADLTKAGYYETNGSFIKNDRYVISKSVDITGVSVITQAVNSFYTASGFYHQFAFFDENFDFLSLYRLVQSGDGKKTISTAPPNNAKYVVSSVITAVTDAMLTLGTTPPETYVPYGYEVDIGVSDGTTSTITPIYIGDEPLEADEYVDYRTQKVYRMINGTLTPTDPPVPLPALPTVEGTTIIDYTGSGTAPEKVYFEYQGGKQP